MTTPFITERRSPLRFFLLVFALSVPLWLIGAVTPLQLLPGLPVSSLMVFCPLIAASILVYGEDKTTGVTELLKRSFDYRRIRAKVWYVPTVLLMPGIAILAYGLMRLVRLPLPTPQFPGLAVLVMFLVFFIAALGEEVGWSGYVFAQADRSPTWIAWQCLTLVASRVLLVWLYNNTGKSVFATALCHAMQNVSWQLFPNQGSHYDPRITGLITALAAVIVTVVWGSRTLARIRNG
jgi:membrane protease YdiL (CAAX protease family)